MKITDVIKIDKFEGYENIVDLCREIDLYDKQYKINDWSEVLQLLRQYSYEYGGFNIFPEKINSYNDFMTLREHIVNALNGEEPLIQRTCRDCQKVFYIYKSEMDFYDEKQLNLPKRCKTCRDKRKTMAAVVMTA